MSSTRDFKKVVSALEQLLKELSVELTGLFRIGKPIPPKERLAKVELLLGLADSALRLRPLLDNLQQIVERAKRDRENFIRVKQLSEDEDPAEKEEPANAM